MDLARNDLGRVAIPGTVRVDPFRTIERYSHVMHLTSQVSGDLRDGLGPIDVLRATLPAGTVMGHEFCGEVVEVGPDAQARWKPGARVTALPYIGCGTCEACLSGMGHRCAAAQYAGLGNLPGALKAYNRAMALTPTHAPAYALSGALIVLSVLLLPTKGLNLGIDFRGGTMVEVRMPGYGTVRKTEVRVRIGQTENLVIAVGDAFSEELTVTETAERGERAARTMAANGFAAVRSHADLTVEHGLLAQDLLGLLAVVPQVGARGLGLEGFPANGELLVGLVYASNTARTKPPGSVFIDTVQIYSKPPWVPWDHMSGTSMSAPHVAGAAALLLVIGCGFVASQLLGGNDAREPSAADGVSAVAGRR